MCTGHYNNEIWTRPFRYRDNIVGVRAGNKSLEGIKKYCEKLLGLQLQVGGEGREWVSFEAVLFFLPNSGEIRMRMKEKVKHNNLEIPPHRAVVRFPDAHSPNAPSVLNSLVPALVYKCINYSFSEAEAALNLEAMGLELRKKGYPDNWWFGKAKRVLSAPSFARWAPTWAQGTRKYLVSCLAKLGCPQDRKGAP